MGSNLPYVDLGVTVTSLDLATGNEHSCALLSGGLVKCWGENGDGQLGLGGETAAAGTPVGDQSSEMGTNLREVDLGTGRTATRVFAGYKMTCALLDDQTTKCWGKNDKGQLGYGDTTDRGADASTVGDSLPALDFGTGRHATEIFLGSSSTHACALLSDGTARCWGENGDGEVGYVTSGDALTMGSNLPALNLGTGLENKVVRLALGKGFTCALFDTSRVKCFGKNDKGQLGYGDKKDRADAGDMGDALEYVDLGLNDEGVSYGVVAISAGNNFVCAVLDNGLPKCWGENSNGQLGLGDTQRRGDNQNRIGDHLPFVSLGAGRTVKTRKSSEGIATGKKHVCVRLDNGNI
eukprot:8202814-Pyramimonas_sp.AAC.1